MIKNPIQKVTNKLQYRAIGIVEGIYKPNDIDQLNKGTLIDKEGNMIDTVILGSRRRRSGLRLLFWEKLYLF